MKIVSYYERCHGAQTNTTLTNAFASIRYYSLELSDELVTI